MKFILPWDFLALALLTHFVQGQTGASSLLGSLPTCALNCLSASFTVTSCFPTNQTCLCADGRYEAVVEACVLQNCTVREALATKNTTSAACGVKPRDKSRELYVLAASLGTLTAVVVMLRLWFRLYIAKIGLGADDWAIFATLLLGIPGTIVICEALVRNGEGKDVWTVPFNQITEFGKWFWFTEMHYFITLAAVKLSLLLFYLRIFPSTLMRKLLWATVAFDVVFGIVFGVVALGQCVPLHYFWDMWDGEHQGRCVNINAVAWANAGISILLDFWMLGLPLAQLRGLNLHWKKKIGVALMFCVGTFVTIISILRLHALVTFATSTNITFNNSEVTTWSTIEINVGILCCCMPAIRQMLAGIFPAVFGGTTQREYYRHGSNRLHSLRSETFISSNLRRDKAEALQGVNTVTSIYPSDPNAAKGTQHENSVENNMRGIKVQTSFHIEDDEIPLTPARGSVMDTWQPRTRRNRQDSEPV